MSTYSTIILFIGMSVRPIFFYKSVYFSPAISAKFLILFFVKILGTYILYVNVFLLVCRPGYSRQKREFLDYFYS